MQFDYQQRHIWIPLNWTYYAKLLVQFICMLVLVCSCKKKDQVNSVKIIGHAGFGLRTSTSGVQHNTLQSFELALATAGISGFEADVQISKDGKLIFFHDPILEDETNGSGCIYQYTSLELNDFKYASSNQPLAQLEDIQNLNFDVNQEMYLDIREISGCNLQFLDTSLIQAIGLFSFPKKPRLILSSERYLNYFYSKGFEILLEITSVSDTQNPSVNSKVIGFSSNVVNLSTSDIQQIKQLGKLVGIYGARSPKGMKEVFKKEPDFFFADDVKGALALKWR
jgi:glycerophosphoryl diester phosphodiesterase